MEIARHVVQKPRAEQRTLNGSSFWSHSAALSCVLTGAIPVRELQLMSLPIERPLVNLLAELREQRGDTFIDQRENVIVSLLVRQVQTELLLHLRQG